LLRFGLRLNPERRVLISDDYIINFRTYNPITSIVIANTLVVTVNSLTTLWAHSDIGTFFPLNYWAKVKVATIATGSCILLLALFDFE
jgi:hypothetical protein